MPYQQFLAAIPTTWLKVPTYTNTSCRWPLPCQTPFMLLVHQTIAQGNSRLETPLKTTAADTRCRCLGDVQDRNAKQNSTCRHGQYFTCAKNVLSRPSMSCEIRSGQGLQARCVVQWLSIRGSSCTKSVMGSWYIVVPRNLGSLTLTQL
jgi:hypothetical protein